MVALTEAAAVAFITAAGLVLTALVAGAFQLAAMSRKLNTGNGHSIGQAVSFIEEKLMHHDNRLDRIEIKVDEALQQTNSARGDLRQHLTEVAPYLERARREDDADA